MILQKILVIFITSNCHNDFIDMKLATLVSVGKEVIYLNFRNFENRK